MKGDGTWFVIFIFLLALLLVLSSHHNAFTVKQSLNTTEHISVELPFCHTYQECKTILKQKGFTDEQIREANIRCDATKCYGDATWVES